MTSGGFGRPLSQRFHPAQVVHERSGPGHLPQLDGLRAIGVMCVLVAHYLPDDHMVRRAVSWGDIGVQLFFVLSGFLITGILLRCRALIEQGQSLATTLRQFYIRRFLRIFPLFYASIVVLSLAQVGYMRETWPWHAAYLSNVALLVDPAALGHTTHFWTLAVEEQFYLVWPLLILTLPGRLLFPVLCAVTLSAPVFRLAMALAPVPYFTRFALPPACLDTLGAGSLLALLHYDRRVEWFLPRVLPFAFGAGLAGTVVLTLLGNDSTIGSAANTVFFRSALAAFFFWTVHKASGGCRGPVGKILGVGILPYIGRISYGLYVLHHFVPEIFKRAGLASGLVLEWNLPLSFAVWTLASIGIASLSWFCFEKPLNDLKRHVPYGPRVQRAAGPRTATDVAPTSAS